MSGGVRVRPESTCLGCGCTCDDIELVVDDTAILEARRACPLGATWFGRGDAPRRSAAAGRDGTADEALGAMVRTLTGARAPLVYLAPDATCETQRAAADVADLLRAALDSVSSLEISHLLVLARRGRTGATLGEIRNRSDVLLFWGVDPDERYPRYRTRYAPDAAGVHVPDGRASRTVIAVDVGDAHGPADAERRMAVAPAEELCTLIRLTQAITLEWPSPTDQSAPGSPLLEIAARLRAARYVTIVADADADADAHPDAAPAVRAVDRAEGLASLAFAVNSVTRGALSLLRGGGNRAGADAVLTWRTGYPAAIDFARGVPRYDPWRGTAHARLARGGVDALLVVGDARRIPEAMTTRLREVPAARRCIIGPHASASALAAGATLIDTAVPGVHEGGTVLRMDDVPLPVRAVLGGPPSAEAVLQTLGERIVAVQRDARPESHPAASMTGTA